MIVESRQNVDNVVMDDHRGYGHLWPGVPLALGSAVLFGATPPLAKGLLGVIDPFLLAGLFYLGAGVGLFLLRQSRALAGAKAKEAPLSSTDLPWFAAAVVAGGVIAPVSLMFGLASIPASSAALLLNIEGLATMAIAWIAFRENVDRRLLAGALAIVAGAALLSWSGDGLSGGFGALLVIAACFAWGIDNNLTRKVSAADPELLAMTKGLAAGAVNVIIAFAAGSPPPGAGMAAAAGLVGFFGIGVSLVLFIRALRHLGAARTGAYYSLAPFIGSALAVAFLGEPVTWRLVGAAALMAVGLWLHLSERHLHEHEHEEFEHEHRHVHDEHHQHEHIGQVTEPHTHRHRHDRLRHSHVHYPDLHHGHRH